MKNSLAGALALLLCLALVACGTTPTATKQTGSELILLTSETHLGDTGEAAWSGMKSFAEEHGIGYQKLRSQTDDDAARRALIDDAVKQGGKVIVCPGASFASAVYQAQTVYPEVMFLLLDDEPHTNDRSLYETTVNTTCVTYREEQAGYLAGYALIQNGCRSIGFCGGPSQPDQIRYGHGFLQGAEDAARELALPVGSVQIKYCYTGTFDQSDAVRDQMSGWYTSGTEAIFACNGKAVESVLAAAEVSGKKLIGVDLPEQLRSERVLTFTTKANERVVKQALFALYEHGGFWDEMRAGQTLRYGVAENGVGLAIGTWSFQNYTIEAYQTVLSELAGDLRPVDGHANRAEWPPLSICVLEDQTTLEHQG